MAVLPIILEDLVANNLQNDILHALKYDTAWNYIDGTSAPDAVVDQNDYKIKDNPQMVHYIINEHIVESHMAELVAPLCLAIEEKLKIKIDHVVRVKSNMLLRDSGSTDFYHVPHVDGADEDWLSVIYYAEDSDGDTIIFDKTVEQGPFNLSAVKTITPKQGKAIAFPSKIFHTSQSPVTNDTRVIINFILKLSQGTNAIELCS